MDRQRGRRKRVLVTAVVLALLAIGFYVGAFLVDIYFHSPAH